jgi:hypothetical protein
MMQCPSCRRLVALDKSRFRGARCKECTSTLFVSATYVRALMLLSFAAAEAHPQRWQGRGAEFNLVT